MAEHNHDHNHTPTITSIKRAFVVGIILNALFVLIEAIVGVSTHSLALLTDAGHNLSDVASLALALLAFRLTKVKANNNYTYGFQKSTILVALINAVILLIAIGGITWEATLRINNPEPIQGKTVAIVAFIGIIINSITAFLFFRDKEKDLNVKGAYLHLAADAAVSLGVVIGGIIIYYSNLFWIDSVLSFVIAIVIFVSTWKLLKETIRLSLDGVPHNIDMEKIKLAVEKTDGVKSIHHIHVWAMSTTKNAMTAHLIVENNLEEKQIAKLKSKIKHDLEHLNVQHATLETESQNCHDENC